MKLLFLNGLRRTLLRGNYKQQEIENLGPFVVPSSEGSLYSLAGQSIRTLAVFALAVPPAIFAPAAQAQPLQDALFTVGTSAKDSQNDDWAYLLFQLTSDGGDLLERRLAIYQKPGGIDDPGSFQKSGNVALQIDPVVIKGLLNRAEAIGQAPGSLNHAIDELFGDLVPSLNLAVEEKLSAVILGSIADPRQFGNLMLLARMHPGVSLCLGLAHAQRISPGLTTFEVRELGKLGEEVGVVGRVVVDSAAPVILPAPGGEVGPVAVPDISPKGHLNARLRWATPDSLRRLALLQYGFNVYRVDKALAENLGWDDTPPEVGILADLATTEETVKRINRTPVLPIKLFDEQSVPDLEADANTVFVSDDNGLSEEGAVPFVDGQRFYYFVTARDILGRDGFVSPGTEVMMHDRVPPHAPRRPEVHNEVAYVNGEETHHLKVTWELAPLTVQEPISGYYVYRWSNPGEVQKHGLDVLHNQISEFIPFDPGKDRLSFIDDGIDAPTVPQDYDRTFWYTVRAVKPTEDGGNYSANSAPAFGVLRNRHAPAPPIGTISIRCCLSDIEADRIELRADDTADDPLRVYFDLISTRDSNTISWTEFAIHNVTDPANFIGRFNFVSQNTQVRKRLDLGRQTMENAGNLTVFSRVGDASGNVSEWAQLNTTGPMPGVGFVRRYMFNGLEDCHDVILVGRTRDGRTLAGAAPLGNECSGHSPGGGPLIPVDGENPTNPIRVTIQLTDRAEEYRIYRRVDNSNLSLWRQGLADEAEAQQIVQEDWALPPNAGEVSYFGQLLDDNGNASELVLLGNYVAIKHPAPTPMLSAPEVDGTDNEPRMKIRWFCPPHGVERFELILGVQPGSPPHAPSPELSNNVAAINENINFGIDNGAGAEGNMMKIGVYRTRALDAGFGPGPGYEISIPVQKGTAYNVQIRAVAKFGGPHGDSNSFTFQWPTDGLPEATGSMVPWPARPLPEVGGEANAKIQPVRVDLPEFQGLGVTIGELPSSAGQIVTIGDSGLIVPALNGSAADVNDFLFPTTEASGKLLPLVLYRYQVPSDAFPNPSRDLIQVSPLMSSVVTAPWNNLTLIRDPFVKMLVSFDGDGTPDELWPIVLLDTQPAIRTASYAYVIVRFGANGEIASVHPVPPIHNVQ